MLTLRNDTFRKYLNQLEQERSELDKQVSFGAKLGQEKYKRLLLLKKVVEIYDELKVKYEELDEISQMLNGMYALLPKFTKWACFIKMPS